MQINTRTCAFALVLLASSSLNSAYAAPGADSAYNTDAQSSHVQDATSDGIGQVNSIVASTINSRFTKITYGHLTGGIAYGENLPGRGFSI